MLSKWSDNNTIKIQKAVNLQSIYSQYTVNLQSIYSQYTVNLRSIYSQFTVNIQSIYSQFTVNLRSIYGQFTVNLRSIYDQIKYIDTLSQDVPDTCCKMKSTDCGKGLFTNATTDGIYLVVRGSFYRYLR